MNNEAVYGAIKRTILSHLPDARVLLFGSRARGNQDKHSDYDLLVITQNPLTDKEKINWCTALNWAIVKTVHIPIDLLLYSEDEILVKKEWPGHIIRSAMREGIAL